LALPRRPFYILPMPPDSPPAAVAAPELPISPRPGLIELFTAFARMSLSGFGGVLAFARRGIVEQHKWMTAEEFNETFALCHFLPGPNIVNLSVVFGSRFRGIAGGFAAFAGLVGPPVVIVTILGVLYARFGEIDALRRILAGVSCAAVGLLISVVFRMMMPLIGKRDAIALAVMVAVFVAIGVLRLPLPSVLLVAIPLSVGIVFAMRRRGSA
jgi:chromate transporter